MKTDRVFRLFISSTFGDFLEEREVLRSQVFPCLEEFCAKKGVRFQAVDLRWGITEEAQKERETIQICLEEVRRCQELSPKPNFVVLLGDRYGWEPIPEQISVNHWDRIINELRGQNATEALEIIDSAYRRDENASPPVYCLKPREGAWEDGEKKDTEIQKALRMATASFDGYDRLPYFASATHQEIAMGALAVPDADKHVQVYIRHIKHLDLPKGKAFVDWDENLKARVPGAADRLNKLEKVIRQRLASDNVHTMRCRWHRRHKRPSRHHLRKFANDFYRHQVRLISEELEAHEQETAENKVNKHRLFAEERSKSFVGRLLEIDQICSYLDRREEPASPLIISGDGGIGKTSLLARSFLQAADQTCTQQAPVTIAKFIGGVVGIETLDNLLQSIISSISSAYEMDSVQPTGDIEDTIKEFTNKLSLASGSKPIWLFIDALDQLNEENDPPLSHWLPVVLPDNVRVVISTRPETLTHGLAGLQGYTQLQLDKMSRVDGETLLNEWLSQSRATKNNVDLLPSSERTLTAEQRNVVLNTFESNGNPLWLRLACEEARRWRSWDRINTKALPETVREMTKNFIQEYLLKKRKHAEIYTHRALSYIAASRYGLSEDEIAIALGKDSSVRKEFESSERTPVKWQNQEALPPIIWSRLFLDLSPYLTSAYIDGALVYRFFHREFQEVAAEIAASETEIHQIHAHLAQVFSKPYGADLYKLTDASKPTQDSRALRRIMEQPWQLAKAEYTEELQKLLTDFSFCMAKCAANRSEDLLKDIRSAKSIGAFNNKTSIFWANEFLGRLCFLLGSGSSSWPAHRILLQLSMEYPHRSPLKIQSDIWIDNQKIDWTIAHLGAVDHDTYANTCECLLAGHSEGINGIETIGDGKIISWARSELRVWNYHTGSVIRTFDNISGRILRTKKINDRLAIVISENSQFLIDLKTLSKPYFIEQNKASVLLPNTDIDSYFSELIFRRELKLDGRKEELQNLDNDDVASAFYTINDFDSYINAKYLPDGRILSFSSDGTLRIWDGFSGDLVSELKGHTDSLVYATMLSNGQLISWSRSETIMRKWNIESEQSTVVHDWDPATREVIILRDGRIISWSDTGRAVIWSSDFSNQLSTLDGHSSSINGADILASGELITYSEDGTIRIWNPIINNHPLKKDGHLASEPFIRAISLKNNNILSWTPKKAIVWSGIDASILSKQEFPALITGVTPLKSGDAILTLLDGRVRKLSNPSFDFFRTPPHETLVRIEIAGEKTINIISESKNNNQIKLVSREFHTEDGEEIRSKNRDIFKTTKSKPELPKSNITTHPHNEAVAILNKSNRYNASYTYYGYEIEPPKNSIVIATPRGVEAIIFTESTRTIAFSKNGDLFAISGFYELTANKVIIKN
nr:DUF4062 domain-containing protein [Marinobacter sp. G11]